MANEWQDIATAPKDNGSYLVWCPENRCTFAVTWDHGVWKYFGGWGNLEYVPTLWQPMPEAPYPFVPESDDEPPDADPTDLFVDNGGES